jgi:hypothetical protein
MNEDPSRSDELSNTMDLYQEVSVTDLTFKFEHIAEKS